MAHLEAGMAGLGVGSMHKALIDEAPARKDWSAMVYGKQAFAGAQKTNAGLLAPFERRMAAFVLPRIPPWIETYHLTLVTALWPIGIVVFSACAARDLRWLWMVNAMIVAHYFTDHFDGKLGKYRDTGLRKWGFYVDHFIDYGFLCALLIGYSLLLPERAVFTMMLALCVFSAFMFHSYLMLAAKEEFTISVWRFGPTELRIALIVCNGLLVRSGVRPLGAALPWVAGAGVIALGVVAYAAQKMLWRSDMLAKRNADRA
jgi:archaetidylinositol phosphate synthase